MEHRTAQKSGKDSLFESYPTTSASFLSGYIRSQGQSSDRMPRGRREAQNRQSCNPWCWSAPENVICLGQTFGGTGLGNVEVLWCRRFWVCSASPGVLPFYSTGGSYFGLASLSYGLGSGVSHYIGWYLVQWCSDGGYEFFPLFLGSFAMLVGVMYWIISNFKGPMSYPAIWI